MQVKRDLPLERRHVLHSLGNGVAWSQHDFLITHRGRKWTMFHYQGKTALITGASSGIGRAFALALAERGMDVVLIARREELLRDLANDLMQRYGVRTEVIAADLSQGGAAFQVQQAVAERGVAIDLLVNNAGFAAHGGFETLAAERDHEQVMVDVTAVVDLTHAFIPSLLQRTPGAAIINIASTASFQPLPYMAVYGASKAFVLSFSQALAEEYRARGLRVLALCPGATATAFFDIAGEEAAFGRRRTAESNALLAQLTRFFPRRFVAQMAGRTLRPRQDTAASGISARKP
jgi:short-subunit dehydrogenase